MSELIDEDAGVNLTTQQALEGRALAPRFYCTDYPAMEQIDVTPVRAEWDQMIARF